ncbi:DNA cytosine methyltransferase [Acutalibacter intestini]|uniref:DNA cytosine methyltransferase n=1 Tax=Acutalibacter intestini TaxID=3093659 RepID=UPI002AC8EF7F|nr:DNA cytosine methyltransferase [Acutalibacter sp. M00204]
MLKDKSMTYVTLFSSAGVGCHGFQMEGYRCIATNEIIERRMQVQRCNHKCEYDSGYIVGDITSDVIKQRIYSEIRKWKHKGNDRVDVIIATPPCQGISVINHKKNDKEINRNSLVVESVEIIRQINPRFFIFENVMAFQKTLCITPDGRTVPIGEYVREVLGKDYVISGRILNFMNYGSNSSRTRTLMIGVDKAYRNNITPYDLYPEFRPEKTLREVIYDFPRLEWGEIYVDDFYHAFRTYKSEMREWIHDLKEGESAFDNDSPEKRPHRVVNGQIVENIRKNRDKYTRQPWDRFIQCVHTRNDQLAAQNTIHPEQDRVYSIRELMAMMTIPDDFRWVDMSLEELNALSNEEKLDVYKSHEMNIRQCLGEAVPTEIMRQLAAAIRNKLAQKRCESIEINRIIADYHLDNRENLRAFLRDNPMELDVASLMRITELCNARREKNAAFYTNKFIVNEIMGSLPTFSKDEIRILEPSVGAGSFIPFLFRRYENVPHVILDVVDIDPDSIETFDIMLEKLDIPQNFTINRICQDFLTYRTIHRYDLAVGNPPFSKLKERTPEIELSLASNANHVTNNLSEMFLEKCIRCSDCVALVLNKTLLSTEEFEDTRNLLRQMRIETIIDFGRYGFTGVSIETMCLIVYPKMKPRETSVYSMKFNRKSVREQSYLTDKRFPYFIIYRDEDFDAVADKLIFNVFSVFRDRQITKSITSSERVGPSLWVIKAKNIDDDGQGITHIPGYDVYLPEEIAVTLSAYQYVDDSSVYLTPNMTYNPRVIENLPGIIPDGSVAVLIPKKPLRLTKRQRAYFSTEEYRRFYGIARNLSTQSINVDKTSVFFYGVLKENDK